MKRTWILSLAFAALPLLADEPKKSTETKPATAAPAAAQPAAITAPESPLVRAARLANRLGRKSSAPLITNATLARSGGNAHVSTTASQAPIQAPPPGQPPAPTPEMVHAQEREKARQEQVAVQEKQARARAEEEEKLARRAVALEEGEGGQGDDAEEIASGPDGKPPVD